MNTQYQQDVYYRFSPFAKNWIATGGVLVFCDGHQCFWILDTLASYVPELSTRQGADYFLIVTVEINPDQTAVFTIKQENHDRDGEDYSVLVRQEIDYTDLKEDLKFWAINETTGAYDPTAQTVVLLPEEY